MDTVDLNNNIRKVVQHFLEDGEKLTKISSALGFTTTSQLHRATEGKGTPSAKAISAMINNLKVSPTFLFLGKGDMFLKDETDEERFSKLIIELKAQIEDMEETIQKQNEEIIKQKDQREDLIEIALRSMKASNLNPNPEDIDKLSKK